MRKNLTWCVYTIIMGQTARLTRYVIESKHSSPELAVKASKKRKKLDGRKGIFDRLDRHLIGKTKEIEELQQYETN